MADGSGNLYIGGYFKVVGDAIAYGIAKWNGISWSALGSGTGSPYPWVNALAIAPVRCPQLVGGNQSQGIEQGDIVHSPITEKLEPA